jgi:hypothetical protein
MTFFGIKRGCDLRRIKPKLFFYLEIVPQKVIVSIMKGLRTFLLPLEKWVKVFYFVKLINLKQVLN